MSQALYWIDGKWQSLEVDNADNLDGKDSLDFSFAGHKHFKSEIADLPGNVTTTQDGFMSVADKKKLDNIAVNANSYTHPSTHPASMITDLHSAATTGNASTAVKLLTARTITIGNTSKTFDGTADIGFTLSDVGALPLSGGKITGSLAVTGGTFTAPSMGVDTTMNIIAQVGNEINFGGTNASGTIYIGYRASGSKPIPSTFVFGGSQGIALLKGSQFQSSVVTGISPFIVDSTTLVNNLNVDMLDGKHASDFATSTHTHTKAQITDFPSSLPANGGDATTLKGRDICGEVDSLKSSVSSGKQEIATAITGKGISASSSDSFSVLSSKISSITTGTSTTDATATVSDILLGKTAYANGVKITGSMPNKGAVNTTLYTPGSSYTIPAGYHNGLGKVICYSSLYTTTQMRNKMASLVYYTMHYAFDSAEMLKAPYLAFEMMEGAMQSSHLKSIGFNSETTIYLEGDQVLFIWGGGYVLNHSGSTYDECGSGKYRGYFFSDMDEEYDVTLTNNGVGCTYYIFNF